VANAITVAKTMMQFVKTNLISKVYLIYLIIFLAFRVENEHLTNVGKFRAFKSVPLPFNYDEDEDKDD